MWRAALLLLGDPGVLEILRVPHLQCWPRVFVFLWAELEGGWGSACSCLQAAGRSLQCLWPWAADVLVSCVGQRFEEGPGHMEFLWLGPVLGL